MEKSTDNASAFRMMKLAFITVLMLVCSAATAQTLVFEETFNKCDSKGGNDGSWTAPSGTTKITADSSNWTTAYAYAANKCVKLATGSYKGTLTSPSIAAVDGESFQLTVRAGACTNKTPKLTVTASSGTISPASVSIDAGEFKDYVFTIATVKRDFTVTLSIPSGQQTFIDNVKIVKTSSSSKTSTSLSFGSAIDGNTISLSAGKTTDGAVFTGAQATEASNTPGAITYESSNTEVATVGKETGTVAIVGFGEATITATFTPTESDKYTTSDAAYTINNEDPNAEEKVIVFEPNDVHGSNTSYGKPDKMSNGIITISSTNAVFMSTSYRMYKSSTTTISTSTGQITKIVFEGNDTDRPLSKLKLASENGTFKSTDTSAEWSGKATIVSFDASEMAAADQITVTVELPQAKSLTLDEAQTNEFEAYDNYNVTLKRQLAVNDWNTFCVPFDITAEEVKSAFGDEAKVCAFTNATETTVNFAETNNIEAGKSYLIMPTVASPADGYTFSQKTIDSTSAPSAGQSANVQMLGIYSPADITTLAQDNTFAAGLGSNNRILKASAGGRTKGFRAFFIVPNNIESQSLQVNIGGIITGISPILPSAADNCIVYNLSGQRMDTTAGDLKPGIYVRNGKKFIVK